jgi:eukaryotic-like serine/threonine-protein kinase
VIVLIAATGISTAFAIQTSIALRRETAALAESNQTVDDFFTTVSESTLLNQPGVQPVRRELLQKALAHYERFLKRRGNDPTIQDELAQTLFRVGLSTEALQSFDAALPSYRKAREMQERLLQKRPSDASLLNALGNTLVAMGTIAVKKKDFPTARLDYGEAVRIRTLLVATDATQSEYQRILANTYMNLGLLEQSAAPAEEDEQKYKATLAAARKQFEQAQSIRQAALARDPKNAKLRRDLGKGYFNLGNLDFGVQDELAEQDYKNAAAEFEQLAAEFDNASAAQSTTYFDILDNKVNQALSYRSLAELLKAAKPDEAKKFYQQAIEILDSLVEENSSVVSYQTELAAVLTNLSSLESAAGRGNEARLALERARDILTKVVKKHPGGPRYQYDLAVTLRELAGKQTQAGDARSALGSFKSAVAIFKDLASKYPQEPGYQHDLALALRDLAKEQDASGEDVQAADNLRESIRLLDELVRKHPHDPDYSQQLEKTKAVVLAAGTR